MAEGMTNVNDIINKYLAQSTGSTKTAGVNDDVNSLTDGLEDRVKIASEKGIRDAENLVKISAFVGQTIGDQVYDRFASRFAESFGYSPEVTKVASLQDVMYDALLKVADQVTGTTASGAAANAAAEEVQIGESAAHHANLAINAANDVVQSLDQGDAHTAVQQLQVAKANIESAQHHAARSSNPVVHQHVAAAQQAVSAAASIAGSHALAQSSAPASATMSSTAQ